MLALLAILCVLVTLVYFVGKRNFDYWKKRGVKHDEPQLFFGNIQRQVFQKISMTDMYTETYQKYPEERFIGFFSANQPTLILRDPELIKAVLTTDFSYFYSRGFLPDKEVYEPLLKNLFFADGDLWKLLRQKMTPAFTSGKLKAMFPLIVEKTEKMTALIEDAANKETEVDIRDIMAKYTTDFIGAVGFGIDSESMKNEDSQFRKVGKRIFTVTKWDAFTGMFKFIFPQIFKRQHLFHSMIEKNIMQLLRAILKLRNYTPSGRNDFVDQLIELKLKGKISVESVEHRNADGSPILVDMELDECLMAGQLFVFFAAGFETSSSASSYTLHQLALHPEAQRKCQQEIDEVLSRHNNKLCYEACTEMKYLDLCFREGMRMFPSLGFLKRRCDKRYHVPGTNFSVDPKVYVIIPINAIHRDPKHFDDPDQFIPERFENGRHHKFAYLPFGEGPRACIGERLARMQSLAGIAALLRHYSVAPGPHTQREPPRDPTTIVVQSVTNGIPLRLLKRDQI